jgi:putative ABC transport system ATP-binding protein
LAAADAKASSSDEARRDTRASYGRDCAEAFVIAITAVRLGSQIPLLLVGEGRVGATARLRAAQPCNPRGGRSPDSHDNSVVRDRSHAVFAARALTKVYQMGEVTVQALRGVDFDLFAGELVVLLGPSGSGKSTLLNILGGLDVPTSGTVVYQDHNLTAAGEAALTAYRRSHVGFVFQFYNLIPSLTARENVALVTEIVPHPMTPDDALGLVGLDHRLDHFPAQLSGGEQQRVAIARAIAKRPEVLLCDEPTGALDITTGVVVLEAIDRVNRELGTSTVVITHNAAIAGMADRVVRLADGRVVGIETNDSKIGVRELRW